MRRVIPLLLATTILAGSVAWPVGWARAAQPTPAAKHAPAQSVASQMDAWLAAHPELRGAVVPPPAPIAVQGPPVNVQMSPIVSQGDPGYVDQTTKIGDLLAKIAAATILGVWARYSHKLNLRDSDRALVEAALPQAVAFAEAKLGAKLDTVHLTDAASRNTTVGHAAKFLEDHVGPAMVRLKLDDPIVQGKILAAIADRVAPEAPAAVAGAAA